jgi:hypothetical protein
MVCRESCGCAVNCTIASANSAKVQVARPVGGVEQATATNSASSDVDNFRGPPGRGASDRAAAKLSSTNRRFVR